MWIGEKKTTKEVRTDKRSHKILPKGGHTRLNNVLTRGTFSLLSPFTIGRLQKGETVVSPQTGNEVHPHQCMDPPTPGPVFIVIQCPSVHYVSQLIQNERFTEFYNSKRSVSYIIHMTSHDALCSEEYKAWMHKFGEKTEVDFSFLCLLF